MMNQQLISNIEVNTPKRGEIILRTTGLTKNFGNLVAVKDLNLELQSGDIFGFLGPNGAGKSTTVGMILNLIRPTAGSIELFGRNLNDNPWASLRRIGAVIEEPAFYPYLSGGHWRFWLHLSGVFPEIRSLRFWSASTSSTVLKTNIAIIPWE
jgi:ABC-type multidrug transport system ATPase subunit